MHSKLQSLLVLVPLLAAPLAAQGSPLLIKTADESLANEALDLFDSVDDLPALGEGEHWELSLDDGGKILLKTGQGMLGRLEVVAQPAVLLDTYKTEIARGQGMAQGAITMGLQQAGLPAKDALRVARGVLDFPKQVTQARLRIDGDLEQPRNGLQLQLWLTPAQGTWLATVVSQLKPLASPGLTLDDPSATMRLRALADVGALRTVLQPFTDVLVRFGAKSDDDAGKRQALLDQAWELYSGSFALTWSLEGGGMRMVTGLKNGAPMQKLLTHPDWIEWSKSASTLDRSVEVEYVPDALVHRDVHVYRSVATMEEATEVQNPLFRDGKMTLLGAVAGDYQVAASDEGEIKALIDAALDEQLRHAPLGSMLLLAGSLQLAQMVDTIAGGMIAADELPQTVGFELGNTGSLLFVKLSLQ